MKFYNTSIEEQETHVWIDYSERKVHIYTSRSSVYRRLEKKLGNPNGMSKIDGKTIAGLWEIPFKDKKLISKVISRTLLVGNFS